MNPGIINIPTPLQWHKELAFVQMLPLAELLQRVGSSQTAFGGPELPCNDRSSPDRVPLLERAPPAGQLVGRRFNLYNLR
jgi:hypothetical protein